LLGLQLLKLVTAAVWSKPYTLINCMAVPVLPACIISVPCSCVSSI